ncbi:RHS repeat protein [Escherichia coli]|nr:RHS repeat protein [Escherichia coli]
MSTEGATEWCAEYDEWGNLLNEENPHQLQQLIRLPGQQYDEESGLYYNRHRYYDPLQGAGKDHVTLLFVLNNSHFMFKN